MSDLPALIIPRKREVAPFDGAREVVDFCPNCPKNRKLISASPGTHR